MKTLKRTTEHGDVVVTSAKGKLIFIAHAGMTGLAFQKFKEKNKKELDALKEETKHEEKEEKKSTNKKFREGNKLMERAVSYIVSPIGSTKIAMLRFEVWCNQQEELIRDYFKRTYKEVSERVDYEYFQRPVFLPSGEVMMISELDSLIY
jgi:hypothetical protein